jgi:hypothetical protein
MRRTRLLIVVPAATAAVLAGMSPAAADDGHHHDIEASVDDIGERARAHDDEVDVSFKYSCDDGRKDHIRAEVTLEQEQRGPDTRYDGTFKVACDVDDEWVWVTLDEVTNDLDDGEATVTVELFDDGTRLDRASDDVWVSGADRDGDNRRDRDRDGDNRRDRDRDDHHHDGDHHDDREHHKNR